MLFVTKSRAAKKGVIISDRMYQGMTAILKDQSVIAGRMQNVLS